MTDERWLNLSFEASKIYRGRGGIYAISSLEKLRDHQIVKIGCSRDLFRRWDDARLWTPTETLVLLAAIVLPNKTAMQNSSINTLEGDIHKLLRSAGYGHGTMHRTVDRSEWFCFPEGELNKVCEVFEWAYRENGKLGELVMDPSRRLELKPDREIRHIDYIMGHRWSGIRGTYMYKVRLINGSTETKCLPISSMEPPMVDVVSSCTRPGSRTDNSELRGTPMP